MRTREEAEDVADIGDKGFEALSLFYNCFTFTFCFSIGTRIVSFKPLFA